MKTKKKRIKKVAPIGFTQITSQSADFKSRCNYIFIKASYLRKWVKAKHGHNIPLYDEGGHCIGVANMNNEPKLTKKIYEVVRNE